LLLRTIPSGSAGALDAVPLDTDDGLHEAVKVALAAGNERTKTPALKVVLDRGNASWLAEWRAIKAEGPAGSLRVLLGSRDSLLASAPVATPEGQP